MKMQEQVYGYYNLGNPIEPTKDRFGDSDITEYIKAKGDKYGNFLNNNYFIKLQARFYNSYKSGLPNPSMLHIRDLYYSFLIGLCTRNVQAYQEDQTELNQAGYLFNSFRKTYTPPSTREGASLGTLSWWVRFIDYKNLTPFELIDQLIFQFWNYLKIENSLSTYEKYLKLIEISDINKIRIEYYEKLIKEIAKGEKEELKEFTKQFRQNFFREDIVDNFKEKLLISKIEIKIIEMLSSAELTEQESEINLYKWLAYWQRNLAGGGLLLGIFGVLINAIYEACILISNLPIEEQNMSLNEFKQNGSIDSRNKLVSLLIIALDIANLLYKHRMINEAKLWVNLLTEDIIEYNLDLKKFKRIKV